ncbi:MAG: methylenetetrahydrofolate reductase [Chlamydiae bacterium]|nr:methylenetetrahydrofolate reductase [Chlamydiota bacterium]MBI3277676.1 methylenetetrahydrofolate reductase [Chlamydiota bacterium]
MNLQEKLLSGKFVITAELSPPKGPDVTELVTKAKGLREWVDAVNLTDNNRAVVCMGSIAASRLILDEGLEPITQLTCRDRNRMGLQSDLLGACALGIRNLLVLTGDPVKVGDHPDSKEVFDVDSLQLMKMAVGLNQGLNFSGKEFNGKTDFFIGAAANPGAKDLAIELSKFQKKIECGAQFFQTQGVYEVKPFQNFMDQVRLFSVPVIAGIILLKSAKMARFLNEKVPGVHVPEHFIDQLEKAPDPIEAGVQIAAQAIQDLVGVAQGVHLMCLGREDLIPQLVEMARVCKKGS